MLPLLRLLATAHMPVQRGFTWVQRAAWSLRARDGQGQAGAVRGRGMHPLLRRNKVSQQGIGPRKAAKAESGRDLMGD